MSVWICDFFQLFQFAGEVFVIFMSDLCITVVIDCEPFSFLNIWAVIVWWSAMIIAEGLCFHNPGSWFKPKSAVKSHNPGSWFKPKPAVKSHNPGSSLNQQWNHKSTTNFTPLRGKACKCCGKRSANTLTSLTRLETLIPSLFVTDSMKNICLQFFCEKKRSCTPIPH